MGNWQKWLSSCARWWNIPNQSQPNPGSPGDVLPCILVVWHDEVRIVDGFEDAIFLALRIVVDCFYSKDLWISISLVIFLFGVSSHNFNDPIYSSLINLIGGTRIFFAAELSVCLEVRDMQSDRFRRRRIFIPLFPEKRNERSCLLQRKVLNALLSIILIINVGWYSRVKALKLDGGSIPLFVVTLLWRIQVHLGWFWFRVFHWLLNSSSANLTEFAVQPWIRSWVPSHVAILFLVWAICTNLVVEMFVFLLAPFWSQLWPIHRDIVALGAQLF